MLPLEQLTSERLRGAMQSVLGDDSYRKNAKKFAEELASSDPVAVAANLIANTLS